jgi:hypothetical protein
MEKAGRRYTIFSTEQIVMAKDRSLALKYLELNL